MLGVEKDTTEFLWYGFLLVLNSNYRPTKHNVATVQETK